MAKHIYDLSYLLIICLLIACDSRVEEIPLSIHTGKMNELVVVCDTNFWHTDGGIALKKKFTSYQPGLPQEEPFFKLLPITPKAFHKVYNTHRNVLKINPSTKNCGIRSKNDIWSLEQLIVELGALNSEKMDSTVLTNLEFLFHLFNDKEITRIAKRNEPNRENKSGREIQEKFGISLAVPGEYVIAKEAADFIWFRQDKMLGKHQLSQGIFIHKYPYTNENQLEIDSIIRQRNTITSKHIKGNNKNSFMTTQKLYPASSEQIQFKQIFCKETRGLWLITEDFMGGPYINYVFIDERTSNIIMIDGYVYGPKFRKRNHLRELEGIIRTLSY